MVSEVMAMGFPKHHCEYALAMTNSKSTQLAVEFLINTENVEERIAAAAAKRLLSSSAAIASKFKLSVAI